MVELEFSINQVIGKETLPSQREMLLPDAANTIPRQSAAAVSPSLPLHHISLTAELGGLEDHLLAASRNRSSRGITLS
jgi:hypothetical protein